MKEQRGRLDRFGSTMNARADVAQKVAGWATWPAGVTGGWAYLLKFTAGAVVFCAVVLGGVWWLAAKMAPDAKCEGRAMSPGDVCEYHRGGSQYGTLEYTKTYDQMVADAANPSHPVAWTVTVIVVVLALALIVAAVVRQLRRRNPTIEEVGEFARLRNAERAALVAAVEADPADTDAAQRLAALDREVDLIGSRNGFRMDGTAVLIEQPGAVIRLDL
ncbi:hypothetical protein [Tsukamurella pseudospumae]|uniref:Uncharacterized protein n=1 Tax=Tsukamurella pseudospumae TaxID=239498 RepID=A0A137YYZ5_9ACTN|nr:hypothetical protein [Tsukamurella pseudospumae]KXO91113.1 hypothetical protein AXK61_05925 [Tsukamurella pseudospumae]